MHRYLCYIAVFLLASCTSSPDSKKLGLTPGQQKAFEQIVSEGNLHLNVGIVLVVVGLLVLLAGIWYQYARKKHS